MKRSVYPLDAVLPRQHELPSKALPNINQITFQIQVLHATNVTKSSKIGFRY
jgi:hypothetical protein